MKDIIVRVNEYEAKVLVVLCEKHGFKSSIYKQKWQKRHHWIMMDNEAKDWIYFDNDIVPERYTQLDFYEDMAEIKAFFKPKFKVGDWVYFHGEGEPEFVTSFWKVGKVFKIKKMGDGFSEDSFIVEYGKDANASNIISNIRHATPEEIAKAKGKDIMVGEHKVEFLDDGIKVGCQEFSRRLIYYLLGTAKHVRKFEHRKGDWEVFNISPDGAVRFDGVICDYKILKKIVKKLAK